MFRFSLISAVLCASAGLNAQETRTIEGEQLTDPTRPLFWTQSDTPAAPVSRSISADNFDVSFVRAGSTSPIAVVNNQRVTIGDVIAGATVVGIDRSGITLAIGDEETRISMFDGNIKRAAALDDQ